MDLFDKKAIEPMLIAHNRPAFDDAEWIFELKWDGIRAVVYSDVTGTVIRNKRNKDVTAIYPELGLIHNQIKGRCILDGEIFIYKDGRTDFFEMQRRALMTNAFKIQLASAKLPVTFVAFDLLYLNGEQLTLRPLMERKALLGEIITENDRVALSRFIDGKGVDLYRAAEAQGLEGIVAKRKSSIYITGKRTNDWIKCKALLDDDFVVAGYYFKGVNLISVILAQYDDGKLQYQSHVVMGVSRDDYKRMAEAVESKKEEYYADFPDFEGARWLRPSLVCKVEFMERTRRGGLRQPVFRGLRDDKPQQFCIAPSSEPG